ncbi:MAG: class I SAM-dependent methyltransferase [Chloroflexi bacterium]|nr:class I SAM-dependent methyltransferase [Chloroflexota bacterium]
MNKTTLNPAFEIVAEAYNRNADKYDEFIENNPNLMRMRQRVYKFVTARLPRGSRILDLACGTGTDAVWFAQHGYSVFGVDISNEMLERAKVKAKELNLQDRLFFEHLSYTDLKDANIGRFDLTFSNFGGLNCVSDMKLVAESVRPLLKPGARGHLGAHAAVLPVGVRHAPARKAQTRHAAFLRQVHRFQGRLELSRLLLHTPAGRRGVGRRFQTRNHRSALGRHAACHQQRLCAQTTETVRPPEQIGRRARAAFPVQVLG